MKIASGYKTCERQYCRIFLSLSLIFCLHFLCFHFVVTRQQISPGFCVPLRFRGDFCRVNALYTFFFTVKEWPDLSLHQMVLWLQHSDNPLIQFIILYILVYLFASLQFSFNIFYVTCLCTKQSTNNLIKCI